MRSFDDSLFFLNDFLKTSFSIWAFGWIFVVAFSLSPSTKCGVDRGEKMPSNLGRRIRRCARVVGDMVVCEYCVHHWFPAHRPNISAKSCMISLHLSPKHDDKHGENPGVTFGKLHLPSSRAAYCCSRGNRGVMVSHLSRLQYRRLPWQRLSSEERNLCNYIHRLIL